MVARAALLALLLCGGCLDPCAGVPMTQGPGSLVVLEEEHEEGWGLGGCFSCHAEAALHQGACSEGVDFAVLRDEVRTDGEASCEACHGAVGVSP